MGFVDSRRVALVAGGAPYLGGGATWSRLQQAAPEFSYTLVDPLTVPAADDPNEAVRSALAREVRGAAALVASGPAAGFALEAVARTDPRIPVLLISPQVAIGSEFSLRIARAILTGPPGAALLQRYAAGKLRRLRADRALVRKQLRLLVRDDAIDDALLDEAVRRIADPATSRAVASTASVLRSLLRPIEPSAAALLVSARIVAGDDVLGARLRSRFGAHVIAGARSAAMLEAPAETARHLLEIIRSGSDRAVHPA